MANQVPDDVKRERIQRLVELVQKHAARHNAALVGTVQEVLVEGPSRTDATTLRGRTRTNKAVNFTGQAEAGALVDVLVTGSTSQTLAGHQHHTVAA
jgi:tRNA-2-methylthio-N6-dimethylallyladenosine synthase